MVSGKRESLLIGVENKKKGENNEKTIIRTHVTTLPLGLSFHVKKPMETKTISIFRAMTSYYTRYFHVPVRETDS